MLMDLQELLGREVDLIVKGTLRPYAAETANRDKILIYERERGLPFLMILKMPWNKSGGACKLPLFRQQEVRNVFRRDNLKVSLGICI